ncbi:MAG: lysophospholipid acyltransferase family protein [Terracidiphilus sp.]|nr:lysophospholipid acyltransferase family protein [Terracidiphilus sp.]
MAHDDNSRFSFGQRLVLAVVPRLVWVLFSIIGRTWRFEVIAEDGVTPVLFGQKPGPEIYCFWHQCVLPCTVYFRHSRAVILISRSFDGELITRTLKLFGYDAVRGSSSRSGREGLLGLKHVIEAGNTAIFTADGPRGPIYQTKMGPIKLAQMTGAPIGAFHLEPEHAWVMKSWDHFLVPRPFTRICVSWAQWTHVEHELSAEDFEPKREELNDAIERARHRALAHFGKAGV